MWRNFGFFYRFGLSPYVSFFGRACIVAVYPTRRRDAPWTGARRLQWMWCVSAPQARCTSSEMHWMTWNARHNNDLTSSRFTDRECSFSWSTFGLKNPSATIRSRAAAVSRNHPRLSENLNSLFNVGVESVGVLWCCYVKQPTHDSLRFWRWPFYRLLENQQVDWGFPCCRCIRGPRAPLKSIAPHISRILGVAF
jgi:hypothetical protein